MGMMPNPDVALDEKAIVEQAEKSLADIATIRQEEAKVIFGRTSVAFATAECLPRWGINYDASAYAVDARTCKVGASGAHPTGRREPGPEDESSGGRT